MKPIIKTIINIGLVFAFIFLYYNIGFATVWIYLAYFTIVFLIRLWLNRDMVMYLLRQTETKIFGKTLDRANWEKGEIAKKKIKFVWRRKT